jgi:hypothetical protein
LFYGNIFTDMHSIITYTKDDLLTNALFVISGSKTASRTRRRGVVFLTIWFLLLAAWCFSMDDIEWTLYCIGFAVAIFVLLPILQRVLYKNMYSKHIHEKYEKLKNVPFDTTLTTQRFFFNSVFSDVSLNTSQIESISETADHFFIKFNSQDTITLPKRSFNYQELNDLLSDVAQANDISINRQLSWKWR